MKNKTLKIMGRSHGTIQTAIFGYISYIELSDPFKYEVITGDYPLGLKIFYGSILTGVAAVGTLGLADGLSDLVYGTYHSLGVRFCDFFKRNKEPEISDSIDKIVNQSN